MSIYLNTLGIKNYKVASDTHVWNVAYINNKWLHIDLTWDDPVSKDANGNIIDTIFENCNLSNKSFDEKEATLTYGECQTYETN